MAAHQRKAEPGPAAAGGGSRPGGGGRRKGVRRGCPLRPCPADSHRKPAAPPRAVR